MSQGKLLIIVKDSQSGAEILRQLKGHAPDAELYTNLTDGLERLRSGTVSAVVMDLDPADPQVGQTLTQLRRDGCDTPFVFLIENRNAVHAAEALKLGAFGLIDRSMDAAELIKVVLRALAHGGELSSRDREIKQIMHGLGARKGSMGLDRLRSQLNLIKSHLANGRKRAS